MDSERAARLRDNKRRFRSRRKEYVTDLERSLRELRQQGVQATKEVQLSARRVFRENAQLRGLLRHLGVGDDIVDSWTQRDGNDVNETTFYPKYPQEGSAQIISSKSDIEQRGNTNGTIADESRPPQLAQKVDPKEVQSAGPCLASTSCLPSSKGHQTSIGRACVSETTSTTQPERNYISETDSTTQPGGTYVAEASSATPLPPCKLVTRLAANPGADITQIPIAIDGIDQSNEADGVECSKAYQMLMQFATTEDKLDTIAHTLERGCVANKGPGGGCKVPNKVVWKALDDI